MSIRQLQIVCVMTEPEVEALKWQFTAAKLQLRNMHESPKNVVWEPKTIERQEALVAVLGKMCAAFPKD